jgi:hypothetical protein
MSMRTVAVIGAAIMLMLVGLTATATAQRGDDLGERVTRLESEVRDNTSVGLTLFLFGVFCALWAQNTGRNPWAWFFLDLLFNLVTVAVLLAKNSKESARGRRE